MANSKKSTQIIVRRTTKKELDKAKLVETETYNSVINRALQKLKESSN